MGTIKIWHQAKLITMVPDNNYGIIENGALVVKNKHILWVGPEADLPPEMKDNAEYHSAKGYCITPGLIDCHTHLIYAGNRAYEFAEKLQGKSYQQIAQEGGGIQATVAATRQASEQTLYRLAEKRVLQWLQEGVTTIEIKSGYGLDFETERKMLCVARRLSNHLPVDIKTTFLGAHVCPKEYGERKEYIEFLVTKVLPKLVAENLVDAIDGFCENMAFTAAELEPLFQAAQRFNLPIKVHAEQLVSGEGALLAAKFKAISADHLEFATERSVKALKEAGSVAVLLPGSYYTLQSQQKPPVDLLRKYEVPIAIATNSNPGTSPTSSILLMLNMACQFFHLTPFEALQGVTKHAAKALGSVSRGQLKPGLRADFAIWDITDPIELVYRFGDNPCYQVIKDGRKAYEKNHKA